MLTPTEHIKKRAEIAHRDKWHVERIYPTFESWEKAFSKVTDQPSSPHWPKLASFRNHLKEGPEMVQKVLDLTFSISRQLEKLYTYAHLRHDEDITENIHKRAYELATTLLHDFQQECAWIEPELLTLTPDTINKYLQSPLLAPYRFHLEKMVRMRPHKLAADQEKLMSMAQKPMEAIPKVFSALNNADIKLDRIKDQNGEEHELSHGLYQMYLRSHDRELRKNAFTELHGKYLGLENTLAELLSGKVQSHVFNARARHYTSSLEAALFSKKIPLSVYHSLIKAVREALPSLHRYVGIRKKILQVDELHLYDLYVPLLRDIEIKMDYEETQEVVIESTAPLGKEYQSALREGLQKKRWVDRFENKNKRSGAYSSGCYDTDPYILMNYRGILRDTFVLAHEAGHRMHTYLSKQTQPYQYANYPIFVAEVA